jgi:outer membrane protein assembly factor BamA
VLQEERSRVHVAGGYSRSLTRRFFGIGPKTGESDETSYRDSVGFAELGVDLAVPDPGDDLVVSFGASGQWHDLGNGSVSGQPNTGDVYPALFGDADPVNLGFLHGGVRWDTRDSQVNPYRGWVVAGEVAAAVLQKGGDLGAVWTVSGSRIFAVPPIFHDGGDAEEEHPPTDTLALGLRTEFTSGDLPFFELPSLGGSDVHRGFIAGRWRDRASWLASIEHRFWLLPRGFPIPFTDMIRVERFGLAVFYEAGAVARNGARLFGSRVRSSYGFGLRVSLERAAPFRVDIGFSQDGVNVAAGFGLSF